MFIDHNKNIKISDYAKNLSVNKKIIQFLPILFFLFYGFFTEKLFFEAFDIFFLLFHFNKLNAN